MAWPRGTGSSKAIAKAACLSDRLEHLRSPQAGVSFWHNRVSGPEHANDGSPTQVRHHRRLPAYQLRRRRTGRLNDEHGRDVDLATRAGSGLAALGERNAQADLGIDPVDRQ